MIRLAVPTGNAYHLAFHFSLKLSRVDIEGGAFVKTGEQKLGFLRNLEGNGSSLGLDPDRLFFLVNPDDEANVVFVWSGTGLLTGYRMG